MSLLVFFSRAFGFQEQTNYLENSLFRHGRSVGKREFRSTAVGVFGAGFRQGPQPGAAPAAGAVCAAPAPTEPGPGRAGHGGTRRDTAPHSPAGRGGAPGRGEEPPGREKPPGRGRSPRAGKSPRAGAAGLRGAGLPAAGPHPGAAAISSPLSRPWRRRPPQPARVRFPWRHLLSLGMLSDRQD